MRKRIITLFAVIYSLASFASERISYSGRLVTSSGQPISGPVDLSFSIIVNNGASDSTACSLISSGVSLANGVFNVEFDFGLTCNGATTNLSGVLLEASKNSHTVYLQVEDQTHSKIYTKQKINYSPMALFASKVAEGSITDLSFNGIAASCGANQVLKTIGGGAFVCADYIAGAGGSVTSVSAKAGGAITVTGTATDPEIEVNVDNTTLEIAANNLQLKAGANGSVLMTNASGSPTWTIFGTCPAGSSIRSIGADGSVVCESDDDTTLAAGNGIDSISLASGTINVDLAASSGLTFSSGSIDVDNTIIQKRVSSTCSAGNAIKSINADGTVVCEAVSATSGTVTSVTAGSGLSGGTITSSGTIAIATGGISDTHINASAAIDQSKINNLTTDLAAKMPLSYLSTDTNLGTSDVLLPTQNAVKNYVDARATQWGTNITDIYYSVGRVGIGTTSPQKLLHINQDANSQAMIRIESDRDAAGASTSVIEFMAPSSPAPANKKHFQLMNINGALENSFSVISNDDSMGSANKILNVTHSGKVGINNVSPSEALDVTGKIKGSELCIGADCRSAWPGAGGGGTVTSVASGTGLTGGPITSTGTLAVDVGTTAGKIPQLDGSGKLATSVETDPSVSAFAKATLPTCGVGQVLKSDGTSLSCVNDIDTDTDTNTTYSAGTGLALSGTTFSVLAEGILDTNLSGLSSSCGNGQILLTNGLGSFSCADRHWSDNSGDLFFNTGSVAIGGTTPDASSLLDLQSTSKGFLPPRMTTAQRDSIVSPVEGLVVYNTDTKTLDTYTGATWKDGSASETLKVKMGTFASPSATGNLSVSGLGFKPKLVKFSIQRNRSGAMAGVSANVCYGSMTENEQSSYYTYANTSNVRNYLYSDRVITCSAADATSIQLQGSYISMDADGFTLNFTTADAGWIISYEAIGGGAVGGSLTTNSVTSDEIADNAVTTTEISDGTITSTDIASNTITVDNVDFASSNGINIPQLAADPASGVAGQTYYNTSSNKMMYYNGSSWTELGSGSSNFANITGFTTPGTYTYTVPANVAFIKVSVAGAGGGTGVPYAAGSGNGGDGGSSSFGTVSATGGTGGREANEGATGGSVAPGDPGIGSGGDINISGAGALAGPLSDYASYSVSMGGAGGLAMKTIAVSAGQTYPVTVGAGGVGYSLSRSGQSGYVIVEEYTSTGAGAADNMGNHMASQNLDLGTNKLVGNGGSEGINISATGKVGVGVSAPTDALQIATTDEQSVVRVESTGDQLTNYAAINLTNFSTDTSIDSRLFLAAHGNERTMTRYGQSVAGWAELSTINAGNVNGLMIGNDSAKPIVFGTSDLERMRIDASGNVGIGVTSMTHKLEVAGNIKASGRLIDNDHYVKTVTVPDGWAVGDYFEVVRASPSAAGASSQWEVVVSGTRNSWTESHLYRAVAGHSDMSGWLEVPHISDNTYEGASKCFTLDINGNTSTPQFRLRAIKASASCGVSGTTLPLIVKIRSIGYNTAWTDMSGTGNDLTVSGFKSQGLDWSLYTGKPVDAAGNLAIYANSTANVGIGTKNPQTKLDVAGHIYIKTPNPGLFFNDVGGLANEREFRMHWWENGFEMRSHNDDGSIKMHMLKILHNGDVGLGTLSPSYKLHVMGTVAGTAAYVNASDERYKKDIKKIESASDKLRKLNGVEFIWRNDEFPDKEFKQGQDIGVIAQNVLDVFPEAVEIDQDGYYSVAYSKLVAPLIEAFKEMDDNQKKLDLMMNGSLQKIETNSREITSLKNEVSKQNEKIDLLTKENQMLKEALCSIKESLVFCEKNVQ